ncbi:isoprenoid synthase domain-containing protein [Pyronema domesticum]|uniref:Similar to Trichodiene synthase acc. no. Q6A1B7 n=1 Tax=Pyronema omphalodes (strain CBS 100304) TaxID=1076935 RepID=U4LK39_PYROM|nr:isoprenoid synthase domain-containing protein [Pyronema domesticum]CCX32288.1 Similar to Trichodiene synthase; acc. no. Q6A1B7 [Pyronema omphalodes CBS 100304]
MTRSLLTQFSSLVTALTPYPISKALTYLPTPYNVNKSTEYGRIKEEFNADIVFDFMKMMDYEIETPVYECPQALTDGVNNAIDAYGLDEKTKRGLLKAVVPAICVIHMPFRRYSIELKVFLTLYTALAIYIDNVIAVHPEIMVPELRKLPARWGLGLAENNYKDPIIGIFMRHVTLETPKHYGPYATGVIVKGSIDYLIGCLLEAELPKKMQVPKAAGRWTTFFRGKTGMGELYSHFLFPLEQFSEPEDVRYYIASIPDIAEIINKINDILSFYKESVVGDEDYNYVCLEARRTGQTPVEILRESCDEQVRLVKEIKEALSAHDLCHEAFSEFVVGYIMYHCTNSRYRLSEIGVILGPQDSDEDDYH